MRRSTKTLAAPSPKKIQSAKTTPSSKVPRSPREANRSTSDQKAMIPIATWGEPKRGCTRPAARTKIPSAAIAKTMREFERIASATKPKIDTIADRAMNLPPAAPK